MKAVHAALTVALPALGTAQAAPDAICGRWLTADKQGVVHVYREADGNWPAASSAAPRPTSADKDTDKLLLRGTIGLPMFGRTEEWTRAAAPDAA